MLESRRTYDSKAEKIVASYLDRYFYKKHTKSFKRFIELEDQIHGKDVMFTFLGIKNMLIDEKAQTDYVNNHLPTFAFEIDFINKSDYLTDGWLFDKSKETEYYLLIWVTAKKKRYFEEEDIDKLDCILIKRSDIISFLKNINLDETHVRDIAKNIRKQGQNGQYLKGKYEGAYFFLSTKKKEKPLNIIIHIEKLRDIETLSFVVKKDRVELS